jgi:hypothetical protein
MTGLILAIVAILAGVLGAAHRAGRCDSHVNQQDVQSR